MNVELSDYYNCRAEEIRSSSWSEAFLLLAVAALGALLVYVTAVELVRNEEAREVGLTLLGAGAAYLVLRQVIVWVQLRKLRIEIAKRAMIE